MTEPGHQATLMRIDRQLEDLDEKSLRGQTLICVRDFRSCWVALGEKLTEIAFGGDYKDFGYEDFEIYCARELGLKKPSVKKLMVSYGYMKNHEPQLIQGAIDGDVTLPEYETVNELSKARNNDSLDQDEVDAFHDKAFAGEEDEGFLRKELKGFQKPAQLPGMERALIISDIQKTARALRKKLAHDDGAIPDGMKERAEMLLVEFEELD